MNKIPFDSESFEVYIVKNALFEKAHAHLLYYLETWFEDCPSQFIDDMRADLDTVVHSYHFSNKIVAINKNFFYDPPKDYLSVTISIDDNEGSYVCQYTVFFDFDFVAFDDYIKR